MPLLVCLFRSQMEFNISIQAACDRGHCNSLGRGHFNSHDTHVIEIIVGSMYDPIYHLKCFSTKQVQGTQIVTVARKC